MTKGTAIAISRGIDKEGNFTNNVYIKLRGGAVYKSSRSYDSKCKQHQEIHSKIQHDPKGRCPNIYLYPNKWEKVR